MRVWPDWAGIALHHSVSEGEPPPVKTFNCLHCDALFVHVCSIKNSNRSNRKPPYGHVQHVDGDRSHYSVI